MAPPTRRGAARDVPPEETDQLITIARGAAQAAGRLLAEWQPKVGRPSTKSSPTDPVTEADRAAERLVVEMIRKSRPDDAVLAEEGTQIPGTSGLRWVIDPLDGTVNYLYQRADWAVSLGIEDGAGALAGVVLAPLHGESCHAVRGRGAHSGGRRLRVNDPVPAAMALVATGFSYSREGRRRQSRLAAGTLPLVRDMRRTGSCALDLCSLAAGRVDAFFEDELSPWDWAAGALIAREAGALVSPLRAGSDDAGLLAAGPALHQELAPIIDRLMESS